mgnify:CR=1 FL=1
MKFIKNEGRCFIIPICVILCLLLVLPALVFAEEKLGLVEVEKVEVKTGLLIPTYSKYQGKIGEYKVFDRNPRPTWGFMGIGKVYDTYLQAQGFYEDEKDQVYAVDLDWRRSIKGQFDYQRFRHWTEHDPLTLPYPSIDEDEGSNYTFTRTLTNSKLSLTCPNYPNITVNFGYREEGRYGHRQALSMLDWELLGNNKPLEQITRDYTTGATLKLGILNLEDTFWYRTFKDEAPGEHEWSVPKFERYQNTFAASAYLPWYTTFYANYTYYQVDSKGFEKVFNREAEINYHTVQARVTNNAIKNLTLTLAYRYQNVDNDDIHKWYNSALDSSMTREVNTWSVDAAYRFALIIPTTLKYGFEWESISREDGVLDEAIYPKTQRKTHRLGLNSRIPLFSDKKGKLQIEWKRDDILNPFMNKRNWTFAEERGEYYPQLTCQPTDSDIVRWRFGVPIISNLELSLDGEWGFQNFRPVRMEESQWKERYAQPSITLTYTPTTNLSTYLSYACLWRRTHTSFGGSVLTTRYVGNDVEYKEEEHSWTVGMNYQMMADLNLSGYFTYIRQNARFDSSKLSGSDLDLLADLGGLSGHDIDTVEFSLGCDYRISRTLSADVKFIYEHFNDDMIYLYDMDGNGYMGLIGLTWKPL